MKKRNLVLITLDEVRPDHLSCYGYQRISTNNIDKLANEGVLFENCISASDFTPICHASLLTGVYPNIHGVRDAYCVLQHITIAQILKEHGYRTAGFVGNGLLGAEHGFNAGFDYWDEPKKGEEVFEHHTYPGDTQVFLMGNWWVTRAIQWLKDNSSSNFFVWGHFYHTHEGSQHQLLQMGLIKEGELPEFEYYDAKIKLADEKVVGPIIDTIEELGLYDKTDFVIMSDHGTTLGEHPAEPIPWRKGIIYPQHTNMWDTDLRVALIIKSENLPKSKKIKGMVRSIDVFPTLLELLGIPINVPTDGMSLNPIIEKGEASGLVAYAEDLFEKRGPGALQAIRTDEYKFIRNLSEGTEALYNLEEDPGEKINIISNVWLPAERKMLREWREKMNYYLWQTVGLKKVLSDQQRKQIETRLRALGYIK